MADDDGEKIEVPFEASTVEVNRRSEAHYRDFVVGAKELASMAKITAPRLSELVLASGCEVVGYRASTKLFWCAESLQRIARYHAPAKKKLGEKSKHKQMENERVGALEARRIRQLDVKIAKDEESWIPADLAVQAISTFQNDARSIFTSCVPLLQQKFGDEVSPALLRAIDDHFTQVFNLTCDIELDLDTETYDPDEQQQATQD